MATDSQPGKLSIILHADVVGSTLMVQKDEHLAHERIQGAFRRFGETINSYSVLVLELWCDGLLAEFERPSGAEYRLQSTDKEQQDATTQPKANQIDHSW